MDSGCTFDPPGKPGGDKRTVNLREIVNGLMYVLSTGCQWRAISQDLPSKSTVYDHFDLWTYDGTLDRIHHVLYQRCREQEQREASPTAAIIDSQSVKSAEKGALHRSAGIRCRQEDQGQEAAHWRRYSRPAAPRHRSSGRHPGSRWRGPGAINLVWHVPVLAKAVADGGYQGPQFVNAVVKSLAALDIEIVKRFAAAVGFRIMPKRWIVERTIAWLNHCRRLAKDWERLNRRALAFLRLASFASCSENDSNPAKALRTDS